MNLNEKQVWLKLLYMKKWKDYFHEFDKIEGTYIFMNLNNK